ncbi:hypothetical protein DUY81_00400 [Acidipropionibacterium acidipropionici]|nr:hypothetical protein DUY81_00400 [Acidipropionibacterium acidipropionici]QCV96274.1 hypothetical protein FEZ30_14305 [Acidipropionibacterium acidipropionici]
MTIEKVETVRVRQASRESQFSSGFQSLTTWRDAAVLRDVAVLTVPSETCRDQFPRTLPGKT